MDISGTWHSASRINADLTPSSPDLHFSPLATIDVKAFAGLDAVFPGHKWSKSTRISVGCNNLFDSGQVGMPAGIYQG